MLSASPTPNPHTAPSTPPTSPPTSPTRGLRPVLGRATDAMDLAWITGTPAERTEITIAAELVRRSVGRGLPLLDSPTAHRADGPIRLGRVVHGNRLLGWAGVHADELTHHLLCVGRTGSGKSNILVRLLLQLGEHQVPWIAIDHKRSLRSMLALESPGSGPIAVVAQGRDVHAELKFNPLVPPPGVPRDTHLRQFVDLVAQSWSTGDGVRTLLVRAVEACWKEQPFPTLREVLEMVRRQSLSGRESAWRVSALKVLDQLTTGPLGRIFCGRRDLRSLQPLVTNRTIIEMDGLNTLDSAFFINVLLRHITAMLQRGGARERLRLALALDEAHHVLRDGRENEAARVLREGREVGLGCLMATQTFSGLSPVALANCGTLIATCCRHRGDVLAASQALLLRDDQSEILSQLPVGDAVMRLPARWGRAIHVRSPLVALAKGTVRDLHVTQAFLLGPYGTLELDRARSKSGSAADLHRDVQAATQAQTIMAAIELSLVDARTNVDLDSDPGSDPSNQFIKSQASIPPQVIEDPPEAAPFGDLADPAPNTDPNATWRVVPPIPAPESRSGQSSLYSGIAEYEQSPSNDNSSLLISSDVLARHPEAGALLRHVAAYPYIGVSQRYEELRFSRRQGDALKKALVEAGLLRPLRISVPEGCVLLLELRDEARMWLVDQGVSIAPIHGSLLHGFWQHRAAALLRTADWQIELECKRGEHVFDVVATRDGRTAIVQVETGKSHWLLGLAGLGAASANHSAMLWLDPASVPRATLAMPKNVTLLQPRDLARWVQQITEPMTHL